MRLKLRILVICRGSVEGGLGHLHRAASFAAHAQKRHEVSVVAIAANAFRSIFNDLDTPATMIDSDEALARIVAAMKPDVAVVDMISCSDHTFEAVRKASRLVACISPVFQHASKVDLFFTRGKAPPKLVGPKIFAGRDYTIINRHCVPIRNDSFRRAAKSRSLPIMIAFGGADADNYSRRVIEILRNIDQPIALWLMLGDGYMHSHDELVEAARRTSSHEIIMARTNRSMWTVASNCALAILSGGLSTIEAIYAGLPVISIPRRNDPSVLVEVDYHAFCVEGGDIRDGDGALLHKLVEGFIADRRQLFNMRVRQAGAVDGKGLQRVLDQIEAHSTGVLQ